MIFYTYIEGSASNCTVYLEPNGLIDVTPIDPNEPYSFSYTEQDTDTDSLETSIWHSEVDSSDNLSELEDFDFFDVVDEDEVDWLSLVEKEIDERIANKMENEPSADSNISSNTMKFS